MAIIYPGDSLPAQQVAQVLLDIVGVERRHEVSTGTAPTRFEVPDDVAVEYERRLRELRNPAPIQVPEVTPATPTPRRSATKATTTTERSGKK